MSVLGLVVGLNLTIVTTTNALPIVEDECGITIDPCHTFEELAELAVETPVEQSDSIEFDVPSRHLSPPADLLNLLQPDLESLTQVSCTLHVEAHSSYRHDAGDFHVNEKGKGVAATDCPSSDIVGMTVEVSIRHQCVPGSQEASASNSGPNGPFDIVAFAEQNAQLASLSEGYCSFGSRITWSYRIAFTTFLYNEEAFCLKAEANYPFGYHQRRMEALRLGSVFLNVVVMLSVAALWIALIYAIIRLVSSRKNQ